MKTQCPHCKAKFNANDNFAGKQAKCPRCAKPFIIEPFIETPAVSEPPATSPKPVETPVQKAEPVATPAKIASPAAPPVKSPEPVAPPAKIAEPIVPPAKSAAPVKPPAKITEPVQEEKSQSKALPKIVFVYCWMAVRIIAGVLAGLGLMLVLKKGAHSTLIATFAAADVFLLCSVLIELLLFYRMWAAIADNQASISPAKAVGFLFIPVFSIYWALCMVTGFVEDYNAFIQRRSIKAKNLPFTLSLVYAFAFILASLVVTVPMLCVFAFVGLIPRAFAGYPESAWALFAFVSVAGIAHFIMYILFATKTCNAINALPERKGRHI